MARVPTYDSYQTQIAGDPGARRSSPSVPDIAGRRLQEVGSGLMAAGSAVAKATTEELEQANQVRVNDAMNKAVQAKLKLTYDPEVGYVHLKGDAALTRPSGRSLDVDAADDLQVSLNQIEDSLGNDAQRRAFKMQADQLLTQFQGGVQAHVAKEFNDYSIGVQQGTIKVAQDQMALSWADPEALAQSRGAIKAATYEEGRLRGWSAQQVEAVTLDQLSRGHAAVVASAITSGKTQYASEYMAQWGKEMDAATRIKLKNDLKQVSDVQRGDDTATAVWTAKGPRNPNDPVNIFDMEQMLRAHLRDDPGAMKSGIDALRQRASAYNAQQNEVNAANVNGVFKRIDAGVSLNEVRRSPEWLALPEAKQHDILKGLEAEALQREQRGLASEQRDLTRLQVREKMALMRNGDAFLRYSDPEALASMSREEIAALRPIIGLDATQHLLSKKDAIDKPGGKIEAKMDADDFNNAAREMGLDPLSKEKGEREKIGTLRYRIEQMIDIAQRTKKGALTREEKGELVRQEMARTVTVDPGFFSSNKQVPVIALTKDQIEKVIIPQTDRAAIVKALQEKYKASPNNPLYAPTEANVRRLYLLNKSRAGALLDFNGN